MKILRKPLGILGANCYIISSEEKNAAIIDPGGNAEVIIDMLNKEGFTLQMILLTHGHFDHTLGVGALHQKFPDLPIYIHREDGEMLTDPMKNVSAEMGLAYDTIADYKPLEDGDVIRLDELKIQLIHTPGHSKGSSIFIVGDKIFSGDTLFQGSYGRYDFYGGDYQALMNSLKKIASLDGDYHIYPGHNEETTLDYERKTNPCLGMMSYDDYL